MKIVVATNNLNKMIELKEIFKDLDVELLSLKDVGINIEPDENGLTYEQNSYIKASCVARLTTLPVIADDSGMYIYSCPDILGIHSSRFMVNQSYSLKCKAIVEMLNEKCLAREAEFCDVICLMNYAKEPLYFKGIVKGRISENVESNKGFGYDPIFKPNGFEHTYALLGREVKNKTSHRGLACAKLINYLKENKR